MADEEVCPTCQGERETMDQEFNLERCSSCKGAGIVDRPETELEIQLEKIWRKKRSMIKSEQNKKALDKAVAAVRRARFGPETYKGG